MGKITLFAAAILSAGSITPTFGQGACCNKMDAVPPAVELLVAETLGSPMADKGGASISFDKLNHDFGTIPYKSSPRTVEFPFTNEGDEPLVITRTDVSCKCLTVKYPRKPLQPGETATLEVKYTPKKEFGHFRNTVKVYSNGRNPQLVLFVEGEVTKK